MHKWKTSFNLNQKKLDRKEIIKISDLIAKNGRFITTCYYITELVRAEKEQSDWLSERSEFSSTDC